MPDTHADAAWAELDRLAREPGAGAIRALFAADPDRAARMTHRAGDILLDLSRSAVSPAVLEALLALAEATGAPGFLAAMARGEAVNATERRAALHMALRAPEGVRMRAGEEDASAAVHGTLAAMRRFTAQVHDGTLRGATGARFTDVLNIGIGGSDLGPAMAARALWTPVAPMRAHYLANVDAHAFEEIRARLDPARTLVLVASKTFTTQETMANAALARAWLAQALGEACAGAHLAALSTNLEATAAFGIAPDRVFGFRDWVGGRFSMWSAIGLSLALALGWEAFARLLAGARMMDEHALTAAPGRNLPLLLALAEVWHVNGLGYPARAVLPYDERLARFPAHLQQLEMESLGKAVRADGTPAPRATGPVVFGEPGTNAQHSFMQLIHQGPRPVPVDFILVARPDHPHAESHRTLLANGLAQAEALLHGKDAAAVAAEMRAAGAAEAEIARLLPHRVFTGDRPSVTILLPRLDPGTLGQLVALYEHKVACLGALWGINPFDQWGVELGKQLAGGTLAALEGRARAKDPATAALVAEIGRLAAQP
ncbi:glucose-6-phosphate isomerase [Roseomonas alkaliterrae]|uniref:Glucose-6-phosphate isomerase n=1 Tax=Neoroseomonas alkaliterrae TaxID=1452450 RepID=A0A840XMN2_9PROT|nr:glucose-6-phosphate isomerase [Neoroseomonas alkaliterrae]MBB5687989.1 glucose-6-phosphate isomerase [Neoroseomonas alkaliterrae]MBR0678223.1 glucose-6-phosphate isomerase [Neoroseomonas alkaliterrae]